MGSMTELPDGVVLTSGAEIEPQPVRWLWKGWLALGKLHLLAGAPGQGKTTIALSLAARVSAGGVWPDGTQCEPGNVLIWSGEDDPGDTLLPRLIAAGADRSRIYFIAASRVNGEIQAFDPARDIPDLALQAAQIGGVRLMIVDPIVSVVTGDSHKNAETRRALQPIANFAAISDGAVLGITHFNKNSQGGDPTQRIVGSVAFTAVARVVMIAAKQPDASDRGGRLLVRSKSNIGPDGGGFAYSIREVEALPNINATRVEWLEAVEGTAGDLLALASPHDSAVSKAAAFLRQTLADSPLSSESLKEEAAGRGISWRSLERAKEMVGAYSKRGDEGKWYWALARLST